MKNPPTNVGDVADTGSVPGSGRSPGGGNSNLLLGEGRRERLPTPVFWPGEFHELYSPWGHKESDMTERRSLSLSEPWGVLWGNSGMEGRLEIKFVLLQ